MSMKHNLVRKQNQVMLIGRGDSSSMAHDTVSSSSYLGMSRPRRLFMLLHEPLPLSMVNGSSPDLYCAVLYTGWTAREREPRTW